MVSLRILCSAWNLSLRRAVEKLRGNQEMIKGMGNGNSEDGLKASVTVQKKDGGDLTSVCEHIKVVIGKAGQLFSICTNEKKCTQTIEDLGQT